MFWPWNPEFLEFGLSVLSRVSCHYLGVSCLGAIMYVMDDSFVQSPAWFWFVLNSFLVSTTQWTYPCLHPHVHVFVGYFACHELIVPAFVSIGQQHSFLLHPMRFGCQIDEIKRIHRFPVPLLSFSWFKSVSCSWLKLFSSWSFQHVVVHNNIPHSHTSGSNKQELIISFFDVFGGVFIFVTIVLQKKTQTKNMMQSSNNTNLQPKIGQIKGSHHIQSIDVSPSHE